MKMRFVWLLPLFLVAAARPSQAQNTNVTPAGLIPLPSDTTLVHLDTPALLVEKAVDARLDFRVFGGDENVTYTSLFVQYGFGDGWAGVLRGSFAGRKNHSLSSGDFIRHGGSDIELLAKYQPKNTDRVVALLGIALPDTSAQNDPVITLGIAAGAPVGRGITAYLNPRAVLVEDNALFGLGLGVRARIGENAALVADWTPLLSGENTRRTSDASRKRESVYGIAVRFARPDTAVTFDLGYANGTGSTTGFALTPGLGGSGAFFAAVSYRR